MSVRRSVAGAGVVAVGVAVFVLVWFQPQKLFIDDRVDEAIPAPRVTHGTSATPRAITAGTFVSLDHGTTGRVRVLELGDGSRVVRLEGLETSNGPDLFVYLTTNAAAGDEGAFDDDYVNLGRLKGNIGDQNYDVPADTDLSRYRSVVIWCDRFDSAFGAADLTAA
jgi:hypothetical protein